VGDCVTSVNVYNETGDLAVAQQLLGNADLETTLVYAKRQKSALTKVAATHWERSRLAAKT
jgi:site-specific recombinase XerD